MVWDLRRALLKKQEVESARLMDFEFRLRARTMRLLAAEIGVPAAELAQRVPLESDDEILASLPGEDIRSRWTQCQSVARSELIAELGDPTPHRLA